VLLLWPLQIVLSAHAADTDTGIADAWGVIGPAIVLAIAAILSTVAYLLRQALIRDRAAQESGHTAAPAPAPAPQPREATLRADDERSFSSVDTIQRLAQLEERLRGQETECEGRHQRVRASLVEIDRRLLAIDARLDAAARLAAEQAQGAAREAGEITSALAALSVQLGRIQDRLDRGRP